MARARLSPTAAAARLTGATVGRIGRTLRIRVMDIGKPRRTHTVEPLEDPVPRELPEETPEREEPAEPPREPEQVPA